MARQPSSPSSERTSDGNDNNLAVEPRLDLHYCITKLCNILQVPFEEKEDITCQSFGESVLEYVGQVVGKYNRLIESIDDLNAQALRRQPFIRRAHLAQVQPANHSNSQNTSSSPEINRTSSPTQYSVSSPCPSSPPLCVISGTFHLPTLVPFATDTASNEDNYANVTMTPAMSPTLPGHGQRFVITTLDELGQPTSENEAEVESSSGWVDEFIENNIFESPLSPSYRRPPPKSKARQPHNSSEIYRGSRRARKKNVNKKKTNRLGLKNRDQGHDCPDGFYFHCNCGSKFKGKDGKANLKQHIQCLTEEWKFKCDQCQKQFYYLCLLKRHMKKKHGMVNPLEKYATGCSVCGLMFQTRTGLSAHQKSEHNIHETPEVVQVSNHLRISGMTPLRPGMSPRRPGMSPKHFEVVMKPRRPGVGMSPRHIGSALKIPQKNLRCKCTEQFQSLAQFEFHILSNKMRDAIQCNSCPKKFTYMCKFMQHQTINCNQLPLPTINNSSPPPPPQVDHQQCPISSGETVNQSFRQIRDCPSRPPMTEQQGNHGIDRIDAGRTEDTVSINLDFCPEDKRFKYSCLTCLSDTFSDVKQLREHWDLKHLSVLARKVTCFKCKLVFDSCESFIRHLSSKQLGNSYLPLKKGYKIPLKKRSVNRENTSNKNK